jgi:tetratricopeptide (TPR) repeat protein
MKKPILIIVLFFGVTLTSNAQNLNEIPMYGGKPKPPALIQVDKEFVDTIVKKFGSREAASDHAIQLGFQYLARNDWQTAMRRFNQAWLLTPDKAEVFGGFGAALSYQGKFEESVKYFTKATELSPQNGRILADYGFMYQFWATKGTKDKEEKLVRLNKSIELFEQASRLEPSYERTFSNWAVSLYFKQDYKGAWNKIVEAEKLGGKSVDQKFVKDLAGKLPRPKQS